MDEEERYEEVCQPLLTSIQTDIKKIFITLTEGNGQPGIIPEQAVQRTRIKSIETILGWFGSILVGVVIILLAAIIIEGFRIIASHQSVANALIEGSP